MSKYIIEMDDDILMQNLKNISTKIKSVTPYQEQKFPKVKTGILKLPNKCKFIVYDFTDNTLPDDFKLRTGDKIDLIKTPDLESLCDPLSIKEIIDYSKIPEGSILKITSKIHGYVTYIEFKKFLNNEIITYTEYNEFKNFYKYDISSHDIEVIRWGKGI